MYEHNQCTNNLPSSENNFFFWQAVVTCMLSKVKLSFFFCWRWLHFIYWPVLAVFFFLIDDACCWALDFVFIFILHIWHVSKIRRTFLRLTNELYLRFKLMNQFMVHYKQMNLTEYSVFNITLIDLAIENKKNCIEGRILLCLFIN